MDLLWGLRALLDRHEVKRLPWGLRATAVGVVELANLHGVPQPLVAKRLKSVERHPLVEQIHRHAVREFVYIPDPKRQCQPKQKPSDRLAF